ncbi:MAG: RIP metalloprotease RseP [Candidatus Bostrichicola ureolyticus]|nr:MAG: RIP metalloprotease RseP [Candidatus Bostrichicola ureolyticus]
MIYKIIQLILCISIIIIIHELGHFIFAKLLGTRVERFFLFFDPGFSLFKIKIKNTIYGIGWLPLGGYIKISGIIPENSNPPNNEDFYLKSNWKKLLIMLGGVIANVLLSIIIFSLIIFNYKEVYLPVKNMKYGIVVNSLGRNLGLKNGDYILSVDGKQIKNFLHLPKSIILGNSITINRMGNIITLPIKDYQKKLLFENKNLFISPRIPIIIGKIIKDSQADKDGLKIIDKIIAINSKKVIFLDQLKEILQNYKNSNIILSINRNGKLLNLKTTTNSLLNIVFTVDLKIEKINYNFIESIQAGIIKTWDSLKTQINCLKQVFKYKAYKQVGSFFSIANIFSTKWNGEIFWGLTATLSIWIAFLNILPIPSLDGGYVLFVLLEMITGKKLKTNFIENAITIGFIIITFLMLIVLILDILNNFIFV